MSRKKGLRLATTFILASIFSSSSLAEKARYQSGLSTQVDKSKATPIAQNAILINPKKSRKKATVFAFKVDGKKVRWGKKLELSAGKRQVSLVWNHPYKYLAIGVEFIAKPGATYSPRYELSEISGVERVSIWIEDIETGSAVTAKIPLLAKYKKIGR